VYFSDVMNTHSSHCLNCEQPLAGNYCANCGQKAATHRLSIKHFVEHDVIHGIWHVDRGILYTLKHVLTRPGHLAREYVAGKRMGHFSLVTMLLLLVGLFLFLMSLQHMKLPDIRIGIVGTDITKGSNPLVEVISKYSKWALLISVPIMGKISMDIFKRLKYNYAEHLVMSGYFFTGIVCILIVFALLYLVPGIIGWPMFVVELVAIVAYMFVAYKQVLAGSISIGRLLFNMLLYFLAYLGYMAGILFAVVMVYMML